MQDIVDLNTRAEAEGDTDKEMQAILVGEIYSKALHAVVMEKTGVDLPAFIRHLGASLNKEVTRFNSTKLNYSTLRAAVHDAVQNYDTATKVPSSVDIAAVGPLVGLLQVLEKDLNNAIALMCNARQMRRRAECLQLLNWMEHMRFDASSGNMKEDIRQWTSVVDSLSPDVSVTYNGVTAHL